MKSCIAALSGVGGHFDRRTYLSLALVLGLSLCARPAQAADMKGESTIRLGTSHAVLRCRRAEVEARTGCRSLFEQRLWNGLPSTNSVRC